jgi:hypothetical protein
LEQVQDALATLRANGTIDAEAQPIFLVVREKRRKRLGLF